MKDIGDVITNIVAMWQTLKKDVCANTTIEVRRPAHKELWNPVKKDTGEEGAGLVVNAIKDVGEFKE